MSSTFRWGNFMLCYMIRTIDFFADDPTQDNTCPRSYLEYSIYMQINDMKWTRGTICLFMPPVGSKAQQHLRHAQHAAVESLEKWRKRPVASGQLSPRAIYRHALFSGVIFREILYFLVHTYVDISTWYIVNFNQIRRDLSISDASKQTFR